MGRLNFIRIGIALAVCGLLSLGGTGFISDAWTGKPDKSKMHVDEIAIALTDRGGNSWKADVSVKIVDQGSVAVRGATVTSDWALNGVVYEPGASGITDNEGIARISWERIAYIGDIFSFTVTNVKLRGCTYDTEANVMDSVSATVTGGPDEDAPAVISVSPADGQVGVSVTPVVEVTFSEAVEQSTVNETTFIVTGPGGSVTGMRALSAGDTVGTFTPSADLLSGTTYGVQVTGGVTDTSGNALDPPFSSTFTTGTGMPPLADESYRLADNGVYYPDIRTFTQAKTLYVQVRSDKINYSRLKKSQVVLSPWGEEFSLFYNTSGPQQGTYTGSRGLADIPVGEAMVEIAIEDRARKKFSASTTITIENVVGDDVSYPFQGVKRIHRTTSVPRPLNINVLEVTLAEVSIFVSPGNGSPDSCVEAITSKTSTFVENFGLQVGINGDFSDSLCEDTPSEEGELASVAGLGVSYRSPDSGHSEILREQYSPHEGRPALAFTQSNQAYIGWYPANPPFPEQVYNAVGGNKMLVEGGQPVDPDTWDPPGGAFQLNPRTSVGLSYDGTKLIIIVIDGRWSGVSEGVTLPEMSQYLIEFGAYTGLNLDGGGSSTMVFGTPGGPDIINRPSDAAGERPRPNHLGIYAAPTDSSSLALARTRSEGTSPVSILWQNYPNPFNPETWIPFTLSQDANVTITIHSLRGQLIRTLDLAHMPAGSYTSRDKAAHWDGSNEAGEQVSSGVYFYTIQAGDFHATRKLTILR